MFTLGVLIAIPFGLYLGVKVGEKLSGCAVLLICGLFVAGMTVYVYLITGQWWWNA